MTTAFVTPAPSTVIPANAGISARPAVTSCPGTPAFAGVTGGVGDTKCAC